MSSVPTRASLFGNGSHVVNGHRIKNSTYYVPGISTLGIIAVSFVNLVISITANRESGILKRRRSTPVPAWVLIASRALTSVILAIVIVVVIVLIGRVAYGVHLPGSTIPVFALDVAVGAACFCCLAFAFATFIPSEDAAQPTLQAITLPLYFISGVFVPNVDLPAWLDNLGRLFPVQHLAGGLHNAFDPAAHGSGIVGTDLVVLALWAAAGLAVALRRFRWTPVAAGA
jgi:ABC-2 type transport system permease protein